MRAWILGLACLTAMGCGGASSSASSNAPSTEASATTVADPTDGGRRRAARGEDCDYGGAAERTCQIGLYCCYGPPDDPGDHGSCMAECPEY